MKKLIVFFVSVFFISGLCKAQIGGYSLYFDGSDDYVSVPHNSNLDFTAFTVEAWIFPTGTDSKIMGKTAYGSAVPGFSIAFTSDCKLFCECKQDWGSGYVASTSTATASLNVWSHVAMSWNSGGYLKAYINGVEVISVASASLSITNTNSFIIGRAPWISPNQGDFKGRIDEVRVWNVVRTQAQIKANMHRELVGNESGLRLYFKMSNGSGTTLTDNQTNVTANNGTLINGPVWKASGCFAGPKNCLDFDGSDEYIALPSGLSTATNGLSQFTASAWIYPGSIKDWAVVFNKKYGVSLNYRFFLQLYNSSSAGSNGLVAGVCNGSSAYGYTNSNAPVNTNTYIVPNKWYFVTMVYDGTQATNSSKLKLYVNGRLQTLTFEGSDIPTTTYASGGTFNIAKEDNASGINWQGKIDEVRFWNTARTSSQIMEDIAKSSIGNETGLLAYYNFNYADGTTLYDVTSNAFDGTLNNMETSDWVCSNAFNTWIGSESNAWATAANWSLGSVPASTDNVGIYKWPLGNELSLSWTPTSNNMVFSSTSSPTLNSNFTVNGELTLCRNVDLNGNTLTLGSNGYLNEGNYRFYGATGTITTTRTLSALTSENIGGLGAVITTTIGMGSTTITRGHTAQGNNSSILRYYDITPTVNTGLLATLVFNYNDNEMNWNIESDLKLFKSTNAGTNWTVQSLSTVNTTNNTITQTSIDGFSRWTAANYNSPMPVELISFTSNLNCRNVNLNWTTSKEINNKGFGIDRKKSDGDWDNIGFVNGNGTTNQPFNYSFEDKNVNSGKYSYRIKQIDYNGNYKYYNLNNPVEIGTPSVFHLSQNYPNPFNPATKIDFELPENGNVNLKIYDISGKEMVSVLNNEFRNAGYYTALIDGSKLSSGIYIYKLTSGKFSSTKKMILVK